MPGRSIADVYIDVNLNSERLPEQAEKAANATGLASGKTFQDAFDEGLSDLAKNTREKMAEAGAEGSKSFEQEFKQSIKGIESDLDRLQHEMVQTFRNRDGFAEFVAGSDSVDEAITKIYTGLENLDNAGRLNEDTLRSLLVQTDAWVEEYVRGVDEAHDEAIRMNAALDEQEEDFLALRAAIADAEFERLAGEIKIAEEEAYAFNRALDESAIAAEASRRAVLQAAIELDRYDVAVEIAAEQSAKLRDKMLEQAAAAGATEKSLKSFRNAEVESAASASLLKDQLDEVIAKDLEVAAAAAKAAKEQKKVSSGGGGHEGGGLNSLPGELDDVVVVVALVAAAASQIATLGAAAGAGLAIVGTSAIAAAAGVGVLVAGFKGITGDLSSVAEEARPAAQAIQDIGGDLSAIQQSIQADLFDGLGPAINNLRKNYIGGLQEGLEELADTGNDAFGKLLADLNTPAAVSTFESALQAIQPIFANLLQIGIQLGGILVKIFVASLPYAQRFAQFMGNVFTDFNSFLGSLQGQNELESFFGDGYDILAAFGSLLGSAGRLLGALVTPQTVKNTEDLLSNLTGFMPVLAQLLGIIGQVDIFGIAAKALNVFGQAIQPIIGPLQGLADVLSTGVSEVLQTFAPIVEDAATALGPFITLIAQLVSAILPPLLQILGPIIDAFVQFAGTILDGVVAAVTPLIPIIGQILESLTPLGGVITELIGVFGTFVSQLFQAAGPALLQLAQALEPLISSLIPPLIQLFQAIIPIISAVLGAILPLIPVVIQLIAAFLPIIEDVLPPLIKLLAVLVSAIAGSVVPAIRTIGPVIAAVGGFISGSFVPAIHQITSVLGDLISFVADVFQGRWSAAFQDISRAATQIWSGIKGAASDALDGIIGNVNNLIGTINDFIGVINRLPGISLPKVPSLPKLAEGGIVNGAQLSVVGEAGPEAVVPLNRDLNSVSPDVRQLSAIAQGLPYAGSNVSSTAGRSVNLEPGAIVVNTSADPVIAASQLMDRFVAALA